MEACLLILIRGSTKDENKVSYIYAGIYNNINVTQYYDI
jgi:hypothetical protein